MQNTELRPLGAGELLDRAVTLFVRRFVPIVAVLAVSIVPLMVLEALLTPGAARVFGDIGRIIVAAGNAGASKDAAADLTRINSTVMQSVGVSLLAVLVRLLMWSAIVFVIATAYASGVTPTIRAAYRVGLRAWPAQALVGIAFSVIASICLMPLIVLYIGALAGVVALSALQVNGVVVAVFVIVVILLLFAGFALVGSFVFMAYELAAVYVVTESPNAVTAITAALRRSASRSTWWRTVVGGLVILAITQGGALPVVFLGAFLAAVTHIDSLYFAVIGTGTILLDGLVAAFVVVYATDMRVRREGLDLLTLTRPESPQPIPG